MSGGEGIATGVKLGLLATGSSFAAPEGIASWLACLAFALFIFAQVKGLISAARVKLDPSPLSVTKAAVYATREEVLRTEEMVGDLRAEMADGFKKLEHAIAAMSKRGSDRRAEIHRDVSRHSTALAYLAGSLSKQGDSDGAEKIMGLVRGDG